MEKLSCLYEDRDYSVAEVATHIQALIAEEGRICPGLREAACHAPNISLEQFVEASALLRLNSKTVTRQYLISRRFIALMDLYFEGRATEEQREEFDNWTWQDASIKQL